MVNFCNPGAFGSTAEFRRQYQRPILAGREPGSSPQEKALGVERNGELSDIVNEFVLRRTNALLSAHLPPKVRLTVARLLGGTGPSSSEATRGACLSWCWQLWPPLY